MENTPSADKKETLKLVLGDPFVFDGEEVSEINLEGLFELTAGDLCAIDIQMIAKGYSGTRMDTTRQYAMFAAARVNDKPWEWLNRMKARDSIRLRDMVTAFFYVKG
jgi:hypothetical protein